MIRTATRNLLAHKLRLVLTLLAITLGVSFVVGTYVFTDSLNKSLTQLFDTEPADVVVQPVDAAENSGGGGGQEPSLTMPESVTKEVSGVAGVSSAIGSVNQVGAIVLNDQDESVGGANSTPLGVSWEPDQDTSQATLVAGSPPQGNDQVALDSTTADKADVSVGDSIRISTPLKTDAKKRWQVTAVVDIGLSGGVTVALFDLPTAQKYLVGDGLINQVLVTVDEGSTPSDVATAINRSLDSSQYTAITGQEASDQQEQQITDSLGFLNTFLLIFALVAVFVSAFLIFNTFSMLVAQRTREIALMRAVGASRRQIQSGVVTEALLLSVVAATLGILLGIGLAFGLRALFDLFGLQLPSSAFELAPRTIIVAYAVGILVTVAAAWIPANRASSVPPIAALRAESSPPKATLTRRLWFGVATWVVALLLIYLGLTNGSETGVAWIGLSAVFGIIGTIALTPFLAAPALTVMGLPFRGAVGRLAVQNSKRSPRRTAATASALMIGVSLMSIMVVFASSFTATADKAIDEAYGADFTLGSPPLYAPFDSELFGQVKDIDGVSESTFIRTTSGSKGQATFPGYGIDPSVMPTMINFDVTEGSLDAIGAQKAAVDTDLAVANGWKVGDKVNVTWRTGQSEVEIVALYKPVLVFSGFLTDFATVRDWGAPAGQDTAIYLKLAQGADAEQVRAEVESVLEKYPAVGIQDQTQIKADLQDQINQLLRFIFALLGLAIIIAVLGIVNTLLLSVVERTRELGLLRAIGGLRSQVRRMIVLEALMLGVFGAIIGVVLGVIYGVLMQRSLETEGLTTLAIPVVTLIVFIIAGAVAGMLAAIWPATSASRLNILKAISTE